MVLCLSLCGGPLACWGVVNNVVRFVSGWFPVRGLNTVDIWRVLIQRRRGVFDSRWSTPCRLMVDGDGLVLERWLEPCDGRGRGCVSCVRRELASVGLRAVDGACGGVFIVGGGRVFLGCVVCGCACGGGWSGRVRAGGSFGGACRGHEPSADDCGRDAA